MAKLSFMKWYPADWLNDTMILSAEARGCWINLLCWMWNAPKRGEWTGTYEEFSRVTGTPWESAPRLVNELAKVANLTKSNTDITLQNRRMMKEQTDYEDNRIRQKRFYDKRKPNANLTDKTLDVRLLKTLDNVNISIVSPPPPSPQRGNLKKVAEWFETTWKAYPKERRVGKKAAFRSYQRAVKDVETARRVARALDHYLASKTVRDGFIKNASTWFANWEDYENDRGSSPSVHSASPSGQPDSRVAGDGIQATATHAMLHQLADSKRFPE